MPLNAGKDRFASCSRIRWPGRTPTAELTRRSTVGYGARMATSGAQSIPGVTLRDAYRFESSDSEAAFEGIVFKKLPRRINWEARIDGTSIVEIGETRREAVELAIAAFRRQSAGTA